LKIDDESLILSFSLTLAAIGDFRGKGADWMSAAFYQLIQNFAFIRHAKLFGMEKTW